MTIAEFLARFPRVRKNGPGDWHVPCPVAAHDDSTTDPKKFSLHVTATATEILLHCFGGCDTTRQVLPALGLMPADLFFGTNGHPTAAAPITLAAFATRKRLDPDALREWGWMEGRTPATSQHPHGQPALEIPYAQRDGTIWRLRYRTSLDPGQGFQWDWRTKDRPLIPYGRWHLDAWMERGELWLVEGESDAVTAWTHRLPCLGLPGNRTAATALDTEDLVGIERIWIVQEPGQSGRGFLASLRTRLGALGYTGAARVVRLPAKDLSDTHVADPEGFAGAVWVAQQAARDLWADDPEPAATAVSAPVETTDPHELDWCEPIAHFLDEPDPPTRWIFPDLLPTDVLMLIHGEPRARKSLVGFELALSAATGTAPFGLEAFHSREPVPVLYVQEEDARSLTRPRLRRLVTERCGPVAPALLHVAVRRGLNLDEPIWVERIRRRIVALGIKLLVLDAARRLSAKVDEGPSKVRELIAILRQLVTDTGVTIAVVHHDTKPPATGPDQRRRSQRASGGDWFAACECPIHVERTTQSESLVYPQDYKFSADPVPFTFVCEMHGKLIRRLVGTSVAAEDAETAGLRGKLLAWLGSNGPASRTDLKRAGIGQWEALCRALDAMQKAGLVDAAPGRRAGSLRYFVVTPKPGDQT